MMAENEKNEVVKAEEKKAAPVKAEKKADKKELPELKCFMQQSF